MKRSFYSLHLNVQWPPTVLVNVALRVTLVNSFTTCLGMMMLAHCSDQRATGGIVGPWFFAVVFAPAVIVWPITLLLQKAGPASCILPALPITYLCAGKYLDAVLFAGDDSSGALYQLLFWLVGTPAAHGVAATFHVFSA